MLIVSCLPWILGYADCDRRIADINKAKTLLGWEPKIPLEEVMRKTMAYFVGEYRKKQATEPPSKRARIAAGNVGVTAAARV